MFYRVTADFVFIEEDEAADFFYDCQIAFPKTEVINPGKHNVEISQAIYQKCFHDEEPTIPCEILGLL